MTDQTSAPVDQTEQAPAADDAALAALDAPAAAPADQVDVADADVAEKVDEHFAHTKIESHAWDEAAGQSVGYLQCSCGAKLAIAEG